MKPPFSWLPTWCCGIDYAMMAVGESRITTPMSLWLGTFWPRPKSLTLQRADWLSNFHFPREQGTPPRLELVSIIFFHSLGMLLPDISYLLSIPVYI
jgi:hypothetical protein